MFVLIYFIFLVAVIVAWRGKRSWSIGIYSVGLLFSCYILFKELTENIGLSL